MSTILAQTETIEPRRRLNFDRLARAYRWMEWLSFGPYLWRCRSAFLPEMANARRALVLGDGDGRFTAALLKRNVQVRVDAVDVSERMLRSLRHRAGSDGGRVRTEAQDAREWSPSAGPDTYDLVVTHFFLDCLGTDEVQGLVERMRPALEQGARWVISEFDVPRGTFGRWVARPVVAILYRAFGVLTGLETRRLPEWQRALERAGFRRVREQKWLRGLLVSTMWAESGS